MTDLLKKKQKKPGKGKIWCEIWHWFLQASVATVQLWVSGILAVLRVLVSQSTEDIVLSRVHELALSPNLLSCHAIRRLHQHSPSPNDPPLADTIYKQETNGETQKAPPEETFARLLFTVFNRLRKVSILLCFFSYQIASKGLTLLAFLLSFTSLFCTSHLDSFSSL